MIIGERLKLLRAEKKMTQGDIEKRTGMWRCYIARVENGATVPSVSTLEKMAMALEVPMYQLFFDGKPRAPKLAKGHDWGRSGRDAARLAEFRRLLSRMTERDRRLLLFMAQSMYQTTKRADRRLKA
jgi:transcriptional regulator with XRE-family HTH domain